ncbi:MAG: DegT/DnrJ/EryC1/StrS family aminotransferase [Pirellulaceae bacterium]|nr:DegT/DnrJ/EryC1/StrS family aminotransferase [Pirellulaceae bacterium]
MVLEDAADAQGAKLSEKWLGSRGRMSISSFQATKPLTAIEGGLGVYQHQAECDRSVQVKRTTAFHPKDCLITRPLAPPTALLRSLEASSSMRKN